MCVPLKAHGTIVGAMTLLLTAPGQRYTREDLLLAEELGRRVALAVDNARSHQRAADAIRMRDEVLALVSHDLGTPLSAIQMHAATLASARSEAGDAGAQTGLEILRAATHLTAMMEDLMDFSSFEAGRLTLDLLVHDADEPVREAVQLLQPLAAQKRVRIVSELAGPSVEVTCDRARLVRALSNLISNAIKFAPSGGTVTVGTRRDGGSVVYSVTDDGPGIPDDELPHLFDAYWQAERRARTGMGLGLAIAQRIVTAHGSLIRVESEVGRGSTFCFALPITRRTT
jgi:signal transduction histidine kinase